MKHFWLILLFSVLASAQTTQWFYVVNGPTHCAGQTVVSVLVKLQFYCKNNDEGVGGTYTATTSNAMGVFTFGLNNPQQSAGLTCLVGVNASATPITQAPFGTIPAHDAVYQCSSMQGGAAPQVWTGTGVKK